MSVVIGVYNGAEHLPATLDSVRAQRGVDFECVVVDDGSTDATWQILERYSAMDPRIRPHRAEHGGLTRALIAGCAHAEGEFVARQDVGDVSHPERLLRQRELLTNDSRLAFVSCRFLRIGPAGEPLGDPQPTDKGRAIVESLLTAPSGGMMGPCHGSVMFRRSAYQRVGGYRREFHFAQDLELWSRLIEIGGLGFVDEVLYEARFAPGDISARYRPRQLALRDLIREATLRRRAGESEHEVLRCAARVRPGLEIGSARIDAGADYFIGSCLYQRGDPAAVQYLRRAVAGNPFHLKAWAKLASGLARQLAER